MDCRADGELKHLPLLMFTGVNVGEFLDKFPPGIGKYGVTFQLTSSQSPGIVIS
jgi:hypothetical protein